MDIEQVDFVTIILLLLLLYESDLVLNLKEVFVMDKNNNGC